MVLRMFIQCLGCGSDTGTDTGDAIVQNLHTHT